MENVLKYSKPANLFTEAMPLGNGTLGAMVYGGVDEEKISLNHDTLWSGKPHTHLKKGAHEAYTEAQELALQGRLAEAQQILEHRFNADWSQAYLPMGNISIICDTESITEYKRALDLEKALITVDYKTNSGAAHREFFTSHPDNALVSDITTENPACYTLSLSSQLNYEVYGEGDILALSGVCPIRVTPPHHLPKGETECVEYGEGSMSFTYAVKAVSDGDITINNGKMTVTGAKRLTLIVSAETSFVSYKDAPTKEHKSAVMSRLSNLAKKTYEDIKREHIKDFSSLYSRVSLSLCSATSSLDTDERLKANTGNDTGLYELLFNFGRYLTISSSRAGSQATNLQGIWNEKLVPPWQSNYTVNINTEMNYWPTLPTNLSECYEPIVDFVKKVSDTGEAIAKHYYHADGFVSHHNVDIWGMANPTGLDTDGGAVYAFWSLSSGWLSRHLFEKYEYSMDTDFLRDTAYPIMKKAAKFYLSTLIRDSDGKYILCPSTSPENRFIYKGETLAVAKYTTMSQSIIKELFDNCLKAAGILSISDEFTEQVCRVSENLKLFEIGTKGQLLEWDKEYEESEPHHRHVSHLYGLYPAELITTEKTPELAEACRQTLEARGDASTGGWSFAWKVNLWTRLKDGDRALSLVDLLLYPVDAAVEKLSDTNSGGTYPNMLDAHPPFQIDGNFGVTAGIAQMLLQCECGKVKILPALPKKLPRGEVHGLLAKGNITVGIKWEGSIATEVTLTTPISQDVTVEIGSNIKEVSLKANEKLILKV